MWASEQILYLLCKLFYRTEVAHSAEMKEAFSDRGAFDRYRRKQADLVLAAADRYGVGIAGKDVLDLGCHDGAITPAYLEAGAERVVGVDIDGDAIARAQARAAPPALSFRESGTTALPLPDGSFDVVVCFDVFEHVARPAAILDECHRVLRPGGKMLVGTWGWYHPFAHHFWATLPVPWAHVVFSERTLLRTCRRVYHAPWYAGNIYDYDEDGRKKDKYLEDGIPEDYLNKLLLSQFERVFRESRFDFRVFPQPFGSKYARWSKVFLKTPWVREFVTSYIWVVLEKPQPAPVAPPRPLAAPPTVR
jgi:2-polyprenyl-3-methyl-5-hydroxy-6-metoxy-1,4-benzoquinol methylase